jgi:hypothetical protein
MEAKMTDRTLLMSCLERSERNNKSEGGDEKELPQDNDLIRKHAPDLDDIKAVMGSGLHKEINKNHLVP